MEPRDWQTSVDKRFDTLTGIIKKKSSRPKRRELPDFSGELHHDAEEWLDLAEKLFGF